MAAPKINRPTSARDFKLKHVNATEVFRRYDENELLRMIVEDLCARAGVSPGDIAQQHVFIANEDSSTGSRKVAKCTIVINHNPALDDEKPEE